MKYIAIIFVTLYFTINVNAQTRPSGNPSVLSTNGWYKIAYVEGDSGLIMRPRDTASFLPRFTGTIVMQPNIRRPYFYDSTELRWHPYLLWRDTLTNLATKTDISGFGQNFANTNLTFTGNRTHNANNNFLFIDNLSLLFQRATGTASDIGNIQQSQVSSTTGSSQSGSIISSVVRNSANTNDSLSGFFQATPQFAIVEHRSAVAGRETYLKVRRDSILIHGIRAASSADSMIGLVWNGNTTESEFVKIPYPSGGSGTVTSVGLSMPSAFTVTGSPITTSGTFAVSGAGTTLQYIRGNGTLATFDTTAIPTFSVKVRGLFSGTSPITYNASTGAFGILDATTVQKGAASFNASNFTVSSGAVSLANLVTAGSCINCQLSITANGTIASYADGNELAIFNASGAGDTLVIGDDTVKRINAGFGLNSVPTATNLTLLVDSTEIVTQHDITLVNNGLSRSGDTTQLGGALVKATTIDVSSYSLTVTGTGTGGTPMRIFNTGTGNGLFVSTASGNGIAVIGNSNNSTAIQGTSVSGYGLAGTSTSNIGAYINTTSGVSAGVFEANPSSTNTAQVLLQLKRYTSGTAANGMAGRIEFITEPNSGTVDVTSGYIENGWEDATFATRSSYTSLYTTLNGSTTRKMNVASTGQLTLDGYPALTQQTDTTNIKPLGYNTTTGLVQPMVNWIGGGGAGSASNGIIINSGVIQLGDISSTSTATLTADRYLRSGNNSIYLQGNKTNAGDANIIFDDTLSASAGNPMFKNWIQINSLNHIGPTFNMGTANVEDGTGFINHILSKGFNLSPMNTRINPTYCGIGTSMEGNFQGLMEYHEVFVDKADQQFRFTSTTIDTATRAIDRFHQVTSWELKDVDAGAEPWVQFTGGQGSVSTNAYLYAGTTNQYRLQTGFSVNGGNTSASISTTGPGAKELHLDNAVGAWGSVFLPSLTSSTTSNIVTTQLLPATDGNLRFGDVTNKWLTVNNYYTRSAFGMRIGDFSADQLPANNFLHIVSPDAAGAGVVIESPSGGLSSVQIKASTDSYIPFITLFDQADGNAFAGSAMERGSSPIMGGTRNDFLIYNGTNGRDMHFGTNSGAGRVIRGTVKSNGNWLIGTTTDGGQKFQVSGTAFVSGNATFGTTNSIVGTATNNDAAAGNIGEEVNSTVSTYTNYTTTATYQNIASITLTAGDWDLSAFFTYSSNSATITAASNAIFVISTTTASAAGATEGKNIAYLPQAALLGTSLFSDAIAPYRVSLSGTTTYYLNTQATFTLGNPQYVGGLRARRIR